MGSRSVWLLLFATLLLAPAAESSNAQASRRQDNGLINFACQNCLFEGDGVTPKTVRAMFLYAQDACMNPVAEAKLATMGLTHAACDDPEKAIPECFMAENWNSGYVGELMNEIFNELGVTVIASTRANFTSESAIRYPSLASTYTRCVWEVKLDQLDLCVGNFWETNERRRIAAFTSITEPDHMKLISLPKSTSGDKFGDKMIAIFKPFTWATWGYIVGLFVFAGISMYVVELGAGNGDYDYEEALSNQPLRHTLGIFKTLWLSVMGFFTCGPAHSASKWPGRIVILGYGFFIYISVSAYAASLVNIMLARTGDVTLITSMNDVRTKGRRICVLSSMQNLLLLPEDQIIGMDDYPQMIYRMQKGKCDAAIIGKNEYRQLVTAQNITFQVCDHPDDKLGWSTCPSTIENPVAYQIQIDLGGGLQSCKCADDPEKDPNDCPQDCPHHYSFCNVTEIVDPEWELPISQAMPVNPTIQDFLSAWINTKSLDGSIARLRKKYVLDVHSEVCDKKEVDSSGKLDLEQMSGAFIISASLMVIAGIVALLERLLRTKASAEEMHLEHQEKDLKAVSAKLLLPEARFSEEDAHVALMEQHIMHALQPRLDMIAEKIKELQSSEPSLRPNSYRKSGNPSSGSPELAAFSFGTRVTVDGAHEHNGVSGTVETVDHDTRMVWVKMSDDVRDLPIKVPYSNLIID